MKTLTILIIAIFLIFFIGYLLYFFFTNDYNTRPKFHFKIKEIDKVEIVYEWAYAKTYKAWDKILYTTDYGKSYHFAFYWSRGSVEINNMNYAALSLFGQNWKKYFKQSLQGTSVTELLEKYPTYEHLKPYIGNEK